VPVLEEKGKGKEGEDGAWAWADGGLSRKGRGKRRELGLAPAHVWREEREEGLRQLG
jgi:hypothetical protein